MTLGQLINAVLALLLLVAIVYLLMLAVGCPPSRDRCAERGYESDHTKGIGTVCIERRADGMGVLLVLPDESANEVRR